MASRPIVGLGWALALAACGPQAGVAADADSGGGSSGPGDPGETTASDGTEPGPGADSGTDTAAEDDDDDGSDGSSGDVELPPLCLQSWSSELLTSSIFADVDGDGRQEIWQSYPVEEFRSVLHANEFIDGEAIRVQEVEVPETLARLADVDGDGRTDVLTHTNGQARWYPSDLGLSFGDAIDLDWDGPWSWTWADIDGDGDDDMVVLEGAELTAVRNDGGVLSALTTAALAGVPSDSVLFGVHPLDDGRLVASLGTAQTAENLVVFDPDRGNATPLAVEGNQPELKGAAFLEGATELSLLVLEGGQIAAYADGDWSRTVIVDGALYAGLGRFTDASEPQLLFQPSYDVYRLRDLGTGAERAVELLPGSVATTVRGAAELDGRPGQEVVMYECGFTCYVGFGKLEPCEG